jgi:hypothetical protein
MCRDAQRSAPGPGRAGQLVQHCSLAVLLDRARCAERRSRYRLKYAPTTRPCGAHERGRIAFR